MDERGRTAVAAASTLGAVAVVLDESVLWSGQPTGGASANEVDAYYDQHLGEVVLGNVAWLALSAALLVALRRLGVELRLPRPLRWMSGVAPLLLAAAGLLAVRAAGVAGGADVDLTRSLWVWEGRLYLAAVLALVVVVALLAAYGTARRRPALVVSAGPVLAGLLVLDGTREYGLAATFLWTAVLVLTDERPRRHPAVLPGPTQVSGSR